MRRRRRKREWARPDASRKPPTSPSASWASACLGQDAARKLSVMGFKVIGWSRSRSATIAGIETFGGNELDSFLGTDRLPCRPAAADAGNPRHFQRRACLQGSAVTARSARRSSSMPAAAAARSRPTSWRRSTAACSAAPRSTFSSRSRLPRTAASGTLPNVYVTPHVAASSDVKALFRACGAADRPLRRRTGARTRRRQSSRLLIQRKRGATLATPSLLAETQRRILRRERAFCLHRLRLR